MVANASALDVEDFSLRYVEDASPVTSDGTWTATVATTWRFAGYDRRPASAETTVALVTDADGGTRLGALAVPGADGASASRSPVWLTGPVRVSSSPRALVVLAGPTAPGEGAAYAARARRAVAVTGRVLADDEPRLVVEVPADEAALDAALGAEPGSYAAIAAVTAAVDGDPAGSPVHVFLNPAVYDRLRGRGAQVVMSHEAVHVATRAAAADGVPLWLLEGFADYVALRDVDLPLRTTAGQVAEQVRDEGLPQALPGPAEFDTGATHLGAAYEAAWLACRVLAERRDEQALVALYDAVDDGVPVAAALRAGFGWSEADLVGAWRSRLQDLPA